MKNYVLLQTITWYIIVIKLVYITFSMEFLIHSTKDQTKGPSSRRQWNYYLIKILKIHLPFQMFILFQKQRHITKHQQNLPTILRHISTFPHLLGNGIHEYRTQMRVSVLKITVLLLGRSPWNVVMVTLRYSLWSKCHWLVQ